MGLVPTFFFAVSHLRFLAPAVSSALLIVLPLNHNILAFEQQMIARYGRQMLPKADIIVLRRNPLATAFKPDE